MISSIFRILRLSSS